MGGTSVAMGATARCRGKLATRLRPDQRGVQSVATPRLRSPTYEIMGAVERSHLLIASEIWIRNNFQSVLRSRTRDADFSGSELFPSGLNALFKTQLFEWNFFFFYQFCSVRKCFMVKFGRLFWLLGALISWLQAYVELKNDLFLYFMWKCFLAEWEVAGQWVFVEWFFFISINCHIIVYNEICTGHWDCSLTNQ